MPEFWKYGNEIFGSIKEGKITNLLTDYQLLKMDPAPRDLLSYLGKDELIN
jgi:hypothetical protein